MEGVDYVRDVEALERLGEGDEEAKDEPGLD